MTENNGSETAGTPLAGKQWAVVVTGFIGRNYDPVKITDANDRACPQLVKLCRSKEDAERYAKRMRRDAAKVEMYLDTEWTCTIPIYGVCETNVDAPKKKVASEDGVGLSEPVTIRGAGNTGRGRRK